METKIDSLQVQQKVRAEISGFEHCFEIDLFDIALLTVLSQNEDLLEIGLLRVTS